MHFDPVFVWNLSLLNPRKWNQIVDTKSIIYSSSPVISNCSRTFLLSLFFPRNDFIKSVSFRPSVQSWWVQLQFWQTSFWLFKASFHWQYPLMGITMISISRGALSECAFDKLPGKRENRLRNFYILSSLFHSSDTTCYKNQVSRFSPIKNHHILFILLVQYFCPFRMFLVRPFWVY